MVEISVIKWIKIVTLKGRRVNLEAVMGKQIGIIGGSGVYHLDGCQLLREHRVETPFGNPSDAVLEMEISGEKVFFIPRHGREHSLLPHELNYRANIYALKSLGVEYLISISAVGSLKEEHYPGKVVLPSQFIDWTRGKRERSFFGDGVVAHVSVANPIEVQLQKLLENSCQSVGVDYSVGGSYLCIEGPQFSTKAESEIYRSFGADVIGMTNVPESYLAMEAGIAYATMAMITDYDCWKEEHCTVEEIMKVMKKNNITAGNVLKHAVSKLVENRFEFKKENAGAVMTAENKLDDRQKEIVATLLK